MQNGAIDAALPHLRNKLFSLAVASYTASVVQHERLGSCGQRALRERSLASFGALGIASLSPHVGDIVLKRSA